MTVMQAWLLTGGALLLALFFALPERPLPSPTELAERAERKASVAAQRAQNWTAVEEMAHDISCWWQGGAVAGDRVWAKGRSLSDGRIYKGWGSIVWVGEGVDGDAYPSHVRLDSGQTILAFSDGGIAFPWGDARHACN